MEDKKIYESLVHVLRTNLNCRGKLTLEDGKETLRNLFVFACITQEFTICKAILDAGFKINSKDKHYGQSSLLTLCFDERLQVETVEFLIENGAQINLGNDVYNPLTAACYCGNSKVVAYLLSKGVHDMKKTMSSALYTATSQGKTDVIEVLLQCGVTFGSKEALIEAIDRNNYDIVNLLLNGGVNPEFKCTMYAMRTENPIHNAVLKGNYKIVKLILDFVVNTNVYIGGATPLHVAVVTGDTQIAKALLDNNANVNAYLQDESRYIKVYKGSLTPLDIAIVKRDFDMQKLLLEYGGLNSSHEEQIEALDKIISSN